MEATTSEKCRGVNKEVLWEGIASAVVLQRPLQPQS
jgi:hypothetical protein